jgi:heme/copper-type cytochrome/quinol oxidase subunit 3
VSADALGTQTVARARSQPNGWWGMALFLCTEVALFGTVMGSYFYLSFVDHRWPPRGVPYPEVVKPSIAIGVLVLTTLPVWRSVRAARAGRRREATLALLLATVVQMGYLAFEILLWRHDYNTFHPESSAYGSAYFTLLTLDHAHVLLGILLDWAMLAFLVLRGLPRYSTVGLRAVGMYWYVIIFLSVCVYLVLLSPRF